MNRRTKHYFASFFLAAVMTAALSFQAFAARIAFSDPTGNVGDEIAVTMKITSTGNETINSSDVMLSYDSSALEFLSGTGATGGAGSIRVVGSADSQDSKELQFTLKFRALKAGNSKISISTQEVYDKDSQTVNIDREGSASVTIQGSAADSSDAFLSDLQISPGNLSPSFSQDVMDYTATVGGDTDKIIVSAASRDAGASVSVTGGDDLQLGENQVVCTVTAQDGQTTKTYTITVTKVEGAVSDGTAVQDGVKLKTPERLITVLQATEGVEIPEGFAACSVSIDGQDVQGWVWAADSEPRYCVFYAMNENGETDFYRYDLTEKTLQRYFPDPAGGGISQEQYEAMANEYNSLLHDYDIRFWIIIALIVLSVILLIVIIVLVAGRGNKDDFFEPRGDREDYPEKMAKERKREKRKISKEERYQKDLEEEELLFNEQPTRRQRQTETIPEEGNTGRRQNRRTAEGRIPEPERRESRRPVPEPSDEEDQDFEFIDLGL